MGEHKKISLINVRKSVVFLVVYFLFAGFLNAQQHGYRDIRQHYQSQQAREPGKDGVISFIDETRVSLDKNQQIYQIILIRHGVPRIKRKGWLSFYGAQAWLEAYDTVEVYPIKTSPVLIDPAQITFVRSSPLPRARSTAEQLFQEDFIINYDPLFIEFRNEIVPLPWIKLPVKWWSLTSRLLWMAGLHSGRVSSFPQEKERARQGAGKLDSIARQEHRVVLVSHGFLNRYLIRYLKKKGWKHSYDGGFGYTNVQVLTLINGLE